MANEKNSDASFKMLKVWISDGVHTPGITLEERHRLIDDMSDQSQTPFPTGSACKVCDMPFHEEAIVVLFWFAMFGLLLYGPFLVGLMLYFGLKYEVLAVVLTFGFSSYFFPSRFSEGACHTYLSTLILKYFSYRAVWQHHPDSSKPFIAVSPPHGLFPFGGVAGAIAIPRFAGYHVRGIAANAILYVPIIGDLLTVIGIVSASKESCRHYLDSGCIIGISSGGIAEIFETNSRTGSETECIILKSRGGICKLALQTGCNLLPSYLFGNSKALNVWFDNYGIMRDLSRLLRVSIVFFSGRWGLPIPYRTPMLGVAGEMIEVKKIANPTQEDVEKLLALLESRIKETFDTHKAAYGWDNVELIVK